MGRETDFLIGASRTRKAIRKGQKKTAKKLISGVKKRRKKLAKRRARVPSII